MNVEEDVARRLAQLRHDLRTPLTVAAGFADLLARTPDLDPARRDEYARRIADATRDMREILDQARASRSPGGSRDG